MTKIFYLVTFSNVHLFFSNLTVELAQNKFYYVSVYSNIALADYYGNARCM